MPNFINYSIFKKPIILLRHDIDLSLDSAIKIARIEQEYGISSCFMIMTNSPFYSIKDKKKILYIKNLDHEIGLHFNFGIRDNNNKINVDKFINEMNNQANLLKDIISEDIYSISFHRPLPQLCKGSLYVGNRINAYSLELMDWYLSDSKGNWREGNPLPKLKSPKKSILQLLTHPFWWAEDDSSPNDKLEYFFQNCTKGLTISEKKKFDESLSNHLSIYRSGKL